MNSARRDRAWEHHLRVLDHHYNPENVQRFLYMNMFADADGYLDERRVVNGRLVPLPDPPDEPVLDLGKSDEIRALAVAADERRRVRRAILAWHRHPHWRPVDAVRSAGTTTGALWRWRNLWDRDLDDRPALLRHPIPDEEGGC
jgi:hypothetical protein